MKFSNHYLACLAVALAACSNAASHLLPAAPTITLESQAWRLESVEDIKNIVIDVPLEFKAGRLTGSDACNRMMGEYQTSSQSGLKFKTPLATTRMACGERADDISRALHKALKETASYAFVDKTLQLRDASSRVLAVYGIAIKK